MLSSDHIDAIRRLNDAARERPGTTSLAHVTAGFHALPAVDRLAALAAIIRFSAFDGDDDPYGEHDFGAIYRLPTGEWTQQRPSDDHVVAETVFWKIDYYDSSLTLGSEAPWDEQRTRRVLTIMLANEY